MNIQAKERNKNGQQWTPAELGTQSVALRPLVVSNSKGQPILTRYIPLFILSLLISWVTIYS